MFARIFQYTTLASIIFPLIAGLWLWKRLEAGLKILLLFLVINFVFDVAAMYFAIIKNQPNLFLYNFFPPIELGLLFWMFSLWHTHKTIKTGLLASVPIFVVFWGITMLTLKNQSEFDSVILAIESVLFVVFAVATMFTALNREEIPVLKNPVFWVSSALLVYFAGNIFLFAMIPVILEKYKDVWILHSLLNLAKNLLFLGGFLACRRRSSSLSAAP